MACKFGAHIVNPAGNVIYVPIHRRELCLAAIAFGKNSKQELAVVAGSIHANTGGVSPNVRGEDKALAHFITDTCTGCTACVQVCPVECISGDRRELHVIDREICIDCHACTYVCPVDCIEDQYGTLLTRIPRRVNWPKPVVDPDSCTGCNFCIDICPFDCLTLTGDEFHGLAELTDPRACVGCRLCEDVCAKGAIVVVTPDKIKNAFVA